MTLLRSCVVWTVCERLGCAAERSQDRRMDERFRPSPTQQSVKRTDPVSGSTVLEFPYKKPQEANPGHRGAPTTGSEPREAEERTWHEWRNERGRLGCRREAKGASFERGAGVRTRYKGGSELLQQTSGAVNPIPFSWTCQNVLNHMFHRGWITTVAAARVYCPGQFSKDHSSTKPTIFWAPEGKTEPPSNLDADKSPT